MGGAVKAVQRAFTPPKPDIPQAAPQTPVVDTAAQDALAAQQATVARETERLNAEDAKKAATQRARAGRQAGRGLLLNDELGLPKILGG